jgi:hypothetical protein
MGSGATFPLTPLMKNFEGLLVKALMYWQVCMEEDDEALRLQRARPHSSTE